MTTKTIGVILIHGTMGSVIKKEGEKIWPIQNGTIDHYMSALTPLNNLVEPSHLLEIYLLLKRKLKSNFPVVEEFVYDWRLNNLDHTELLKNKIISMEVDEIHIVAHSMGGIITKICLNENKNNDDFKKIKKVITLGTPWKGSMDAVKTLLYGSRIPRKILKFIDKETSRSMSSHFPSVYQLLPNQDFLGYLKSTGCVPYYINNCYYDNFDDFFDNVLKTKFDENHDFSLIFDDYFNLLNQEIVADIELHEIIGIGKPTIKMISENTKQEPLAQYDDGDGTVPLFSAFSNLEDNKNYFPYFAKKTAHNSLPWNSTIIRLVNDIISGKEFVPNNKIFNDLNNIEQEKFNGYIGKVACPVEISIRDKEGIIIHGNLETTSEEQIQKILQADYEVEDLGTTTYIIFDEQTETNINNFKGLVIDAFDKGLTSVGLEKYENGKVINRKAFKSFEINPKIQVEVNFDENIDDSSLILKKGDNIEETIFLDEIFTNEADILLPETKVKLNGENLIFVESINSYFGKGELTLTIEEIERGTFETKETYVQINNSVTLSENDSIRLNSTNLIHGKNIISFFSVDEYDYTEAKKQVEIYYFNQVTSKVELSFTDSFYTVDLEEDQVYGSLVSDYELERLPPTYKFENEDGVTGHFVTYNGIERKLEVNYKDIFGNEVSYNFLIDEQLVKKIIKGSATVAETENFIQKLNINNPSYQFHLNKSGNYKLLNHTNLHNSHSFEVFSEEAIIKITKNIELTVSFETSSEHITIDSEVNDFDFFFKVLDIDQQYVKNLNLTGKAIFIITNEPENKEFEEEFEIEYIEARESYKLTLNLRTFKENLNDYWKPDDKVLNTAKLEIINNNNNVTIRTIELKLAKS